MLKRRLIPKLQLGLRKSFRGIQSVLVVTRQFSNPKPIGDPLSQAKIFEAQLADELILVDLVRSSESWDSLLSTLDTMSTSLATPLAVGGGIHSFEQVQQLLDRGADKIILNTFAVQNPRLIESVSSTYGSQCVVVSLDFRKIKPTDWRIWVDGASCESFIDPSQFAKEVIDRGAGEIMITSIDNDGSCNGLDINLLKFLAPSISVPIIASGGCGLAEHFVEGYNVGVSAVAAGSFFSQRDQNPMQCRSHIRNAGLPIRLEV